MGWRNLLQTTKIQIFPWLGSSTLQADSGQQWRIDRRPPERGWHEFRLEGRKAFWIQESSPDPDVFVKSVAGYLVGNRLVPDQVRADPIVKVLSGFETVHLVNSGLERFSRVHVGIIHENGPLFYIEQAFPLGPEDDVLRAFEDRKGSISSIPGVVPALDMAFRFESYQRSETEKRRLEAAERRREEEDRRRLEEARAEIRSTLEAGRIRRLVPYDFGEAAQIALSVGNAEYLDHRSGVHNDEYVVRFRLDSRRFECVCDSHLQIIDAGICLTSESTGVRGDTWLSLESLPGVIRQAIREDHLVIFRHAD